MFSVYPEFDNPAGFPYTNAFYYEMNPKQIFNVDFGFYTLTSFFNIFSAVMDLITTGFGLTFYCIRV